MKIKPYNFYSILFGAFILISVFSCQTEPLDSEQNLSSNSSIASKKVESNPLVFPSCDAEPASEVILYAGQNINVGTVKVVTEGNDYKITYNITNPNYCMSETHLSVVEDPSNFPMTKTGNPIPGQFEYSEMHDCITSYTYTVPTSKGTFIAAHAVVNCIPSGSVESLDSALPETVDFCLTTGREIDGARSYLKVDVAEGTLAGSYWGWCADDSKSINSTNGPICYEQFNVYTLLDDLSGIISQSENIDNALWLINHSDELLDGGNYLYGNIQWALWKLLNNQECNSCNANLKLPAGDITVKGMELVNLALAEGEGYNPECEENTMVILDDGVSQPIIITIPIPCEGGDCEETAFGAGCNFPGDNWFTYFQYSDGAQ